MTPDNLICGASLKMFFVAGSQNFRDGEEKGRGDDDMGHSRRAGAAQGEARQPIRGQG